VFNINSQDENFQTFKRLQTRVDKNPNGIEIAYRKLNLQITSRIEKLETNVSTLATIASSSPYIGLFGTVWGIMHSFLSLASVKQATIAIVLPQVLQKPP
jgi:biopolymer transport protein TolQ